MESLYARIKNLANKTGFNPEELDAIAGDIIQLSPEKQFQNQPARQAPPKPQQLKNDEEKLFLQAWAEYGEAALREKKSKATYRRYPDLLKKLKEYCKAAKLPLAFSTFTEKFSHEWRNYMTSTYDNYMTGSKGLSYNTAQNNLKTVKAFLNWAFKEGFHTNTAYNKWDCTKPETDCKWLSKEQIEPLIAADLSKHVAWDRSRDLWLFMAYTGLRFSDVTPPQWRATNVSDGFIRLRTKKTNKRVVIPINDVSGAILAKYNNNLPVKANVVLNREIKEVLKYLGENGHPEYLQEVEVETYVEKRKTTYELMPLYAAITCHSGRRSFINNFVRLGYNINQMNTMTGIDFKTLATYFKADENSLKETTERVSVRVQTLKVVA